MPKSDSCSRYTIWGIPPQRQGWNKFISDRIDKHGICECQFPLPFLFKHTCKLPVYSVFNTQYNWDFNLEVCMSLILLQEWPNLFSILAHMSIHFSNSKSIILSEAIHKRKFNNWLPVYKHKNHLLWILKFHLSSILFWGTEKNLM